MIAKTPIRVLIVDDSATVRRTLERLLAEEPDMEIVGTAADPYEAVQLMRVCTPDVIILDIEMPKMDGLTFLGKIMTQHPLPVIVCSSYVGPGQGEALLALERGAIDLIEKPRVGTVAFLEDARVRVADAVRGAAVARLDRRVINLPPDMRPGRPGGSRQTGAEATGRIVVIGASTGGTEALRAIIEVLPFDVAGIVIAQHMPPRFTAAFAQRLSDISALTVFEAAGGESIVPGTAFVAPGDRHASIVRGRTGFEVAVTDGPPVNRHRPSVDVLFRSAAMVAGGKAMGILLTGMGADGAAGLLELRHAGGMTVAQDEATSVVYGMPGAAVGLNAAVEVRPIQEIAGRIVDWSAGRL